MPPAAAHLLGVVQHWLLMGIGFFSVISTIRISLLSFDLLPGVPLEFYSLTLSLADLLLLALLAATAVRFAAEEGYRAQLWETCQRLWQRAWLPTWMLFVTWMGLSAGWALEPGMARFVTLHAATGILLMTVLADVVRTEGAHLLLQALITSAACQSLLAVAQNLKGNTIGLAFLGEIPPHPFDQLAYFRPPGLSHNPNYLGGYLMLAILAGVILIVRPHEDQGRTSQKRRLLLVMAAICAIGLVVTLSRGAFIGMAAALSPMLIVLLRGVATRRRRPLVIGALALIVGALALALIASRGDLAGRLFEARTFFAEDAWRIVQASPLMGAGAGNQMFAISLRLGIIDTLVLPVHNVYLYILAEVGAVGLLLFLVAFGSSAFQVARPFDPERLLWGGALLGIAVTMLFDNYWWAIRPFQVLFFWTLGIWYGLNLKHGVGEASALPIPATPQTQTPPTAPP